MNDELRLVKITWVDSFGVGDGWQSLSDLLDIEHICVSIGYLALDGDLVKIVVPHYSPAIAGTDAEEQGCGDIAIPCCSILRIVDLIEHREKPEPRGENNCV